MGLAVLKEMLAQLCDAVMKHRQPNRENRAVVRELQYVAVIPYFEHIRLVLVWCLRLDNGPYFATRSAIITFLAALESYTSVLRRKHVAVAQHGRRPAFPTLKLKKLGRNCAETSHFRDFGGITFVDWDTPPLRGERALTAV